MSNDQWIDDLVSEIAKKYRIVLNPDDPVLVTAIMNKEILDKAQLEYEGLFVKNSQLLQQQFKAQKLGNELLLTKVTDRLISELKVRQKSSDQAHYNQVSHTKKGFGTLPLLLLTFMFGLVSGILVVTLI